MMIKAVVGANWGDEGKGKITDLLAEQADIVIRFQGGANAGHTIINKYGKHALHLLPSGVFNAGTANLIGNGVALNLEQLKSEYEGLLRDGVPRPQLLISDRAQLVMPYHILFDQYEEERLGKGAFGSTKSGIAPFYSDKYAKIGFQLSELFDLPRMKEKLERILVPKNVLVRELYHKPELSAEAIMAELEPYAEFVRPFLCDAHQFLSKALKEGREILLEGQLGSLKDPDFGIYPFVTSSHTVAGFAAVGAGGVPPYAIQQVLAITKAYSSAVGAGAFVSELFGDEAEELRRHGGDAGEYGATTGRPRRVGCFDAVATRYGASVQGATEVVLTAIDCLGYLEEIKICTAYNVDGQITTDFPAPALLDRARPVYETLRGWHCDLRGIRHYDELPAEAKAYVDRIEELIGFPIRTVSNGPAREEVLSRTPKI